MEIRFEIVSNVSGIIECVYQQESHCIYEQEPLFLVRTHDGGKAIISSPFSGVLLSHHIAVGYAVVSGTIVASLRENLLHIGAASD